MGPHQGIIGVTGVISTRHFHEANIQVQNCLVSKKLDQPLFIANQYMSLPWMIPAKEHFVVQTNYRWDKPRGIVMEEGGVGGLVVDTCRGVEMRVVGWGWERFAIW